MGAVIGYITRLVGYALLVGIPARIAEFFWERAGLDQADALHAPHDTVTTVVTVAPFVLALIGYGALRRVAVFMAMYIAGAVLTAPFVLARFATAAG